MTCCIMVRSELIITAIRLRVENMSMDDFSYKYYDYSLMYLYWSNSVIKGTVSPV
jgi:hypothetical protein